MVKRTYKNFLLTMDILMHQAGMTEGRAEQKAREIFNAVEYDRAIRGVKSTVEDYLVAEINISNGNV